MQCQICKIFKLPFTGFPTKICKSRESPTGKDSSTNQYEIKYENIIEFSLADSPQWKHQTETAPNFNVSVILDAREQSRWSWHDDASEEHRSKGKIVVRAL